MKAATECPHGLGLPGACIDCLADGPVTYTTPAPPALPIAERWTEAEFEGRCPECHQPIDVGDPIALVDGRWVCEAEAA